MTNFRRTTQGANDVTFANPVDMTHRVRVVVRHSTKKVGQVDRTNVRSEVISNSRSPIEIGENCCGPSAYDATSVRTTISGSLENKVAVAAELSQHIANLTVVRDDLINGFVPYEAVLPLLSEVPAA